MSNYWPFAESGGGHSVKAYPDLILGLVEQLHARADWDENTPGGWPADAVLFREAAVALSALQQFAMFVALLPATTGGAQKVSTEELAKRARAALAEPGERKPDEVEPGVNASSPPPASPSVDPVFDIAVDGARNLWADGLLAATVGMPEPVKEGGE